MVDSRKRLTPGVFSYFSAVERMNVTVTVVQTEDLKKKKIFFQVTSSHPRLLVMQTDQSEGGYLWHLKGTGAPRPV